MKTFEIAKRLIAIAGCAAALGLAATPAASTPQLLTHWTVNGVFDDGGTLTGGFDVDIYGYLGDFDLKTSGGSGGFTPIQYTPPATYPLASGTVLGDGSYVAPYFFDVEPGWFGALHLVFQSPLNTPISSNVLLGGFEGPSYECQDSWSCADPQGHIRYIASGSAKADGASVPEPAAWALMLTGFAGMGAMLRRSRRRTAAVAA